VNIKTISKIEESFIFNRKTQNLSCLHFVPTHYKTIQVLLPKFTLDCQVQRTVKSSKKTSLFSEMFILCIVTFLHCFLPELLLQFFTHANLKVFFNEQYKNKKFAFKVIELRRSTYRRWEQTLC
jgi:hypothetical protein